MNLIEEKRINDNLIQYTEYFDNDKDNPYKIHFKDNNGLLQGEYKTFSAANGYIDNIKYYQNGEYIKIKEYHSNGKILSIQHYKNGKLNGKAFYFNFNGKIEIKKTFKDNILHGKFINYKYLNVTVTQLIQKEISKYKNGIIHGKKQIFNIIPEFSDKLFEEKIYNNGELLKIIRYKDLGIDYIEKYKNGQLHGIRTKLLSNGNVSEKSLYKEGEIVWNKIYDENHNLIRLIKVLKYYDSTNILEDAFKNENSSYLNDQYQITFKFYENKNIKSIMIQDDNFQVIKEKEFKNGEFEKEKSNNKIITKHLSLSNQIKTFKTIKKEKNFKKIKLSRNKNEINNKEDLNFGF